jgi:hypothetical protein
MTVICLVRHSSLSIILSYTTKRAFRQSSYLFPIHKKAQYSTDTSATPVVIQTASPITHENTICYRPSSKDPVHKILMYCEDIHIQGVLGGIVNILGGGSTDYSK